MNIVVKHTIKYWSFFILLILPILSSASSINYKNNFLVITDIHLNHASNQTMVINPSNRTVKNDLDPATFEKLILSISKNIKAGIIAKPQFIILLGDIAGHERPTAESVVKNETIVFKVLKDNFPQTPIFYTVGNNDSLKINYGPFKDWKHSGQLTSPYDVAINNGWINGFLSTGTHCKNKKNRFPCLLTEDSINGFYVAYLQPKLRLISLNSLLFSPNRAYVYEQDAMQQLEWLSKELERAKRNRESVLIAMHIPPGKNVHDHSGFWLPKEQTVFLNLIDRYQSTIIGLLAAHTHKEELKVIKDTNNKTIAGVYYTAGLSTSHGNAPSVKTFYFAKNKEQWKLSDYEVFYFSQHNDNLVLNKLYNFNNYYCTNQASNNILDCLSNLTARKMQKYFYAGNSNYNVPMKSPDDLVLQDSK